MTDRTNLVVLATGMIESGKSKLLADRYVSRQPRVIHIDTNDEVRERLRGVIRVQGAAALYDVLAVAARRRAQAFNIAAVGLEADELIALCEQLAPASGVDGSLARAFGSLALECGEMGALCQIWPKFAEVLGHTIMRSRHHRLSLFMATQYPYSLPPAVRMNAHEIVFFQQDEAQAHQWARQVVGDVGAAEVARLRDYSFLLYERLTGVLYLCDRAHRVVRRFRKDGAAA